MIYRLFSTALLLMLSLSVMAQNENKFHEVKSGETKYGISREYNISIERLEKFNPDIKDGLRVGTQLLIPPPEKATAEPDQEETKDGYVKHEVKAGETMYSLSREYGLSPQDMIRENPQLKEGLKVGQVLNLPVPKETTNGTAGEANGDGCMHVVRPKETAWSLSRHYELSLDSLYLLNPEAEKGLVVGQEIVLPPNRCETDTAKLQTPVDTATAETGGEMVEDKEAALAIADTVGGYLLYKVKAGDSFYSLKQRFSVGREELVTLNPETKSGLEVDKYIIIPQKTQRDMSAFAKLFKKVETDGPEGPPSIDQVSLKDSLNEPIRTEDEKEPVDEDTLDVDLDRELRVALMLPFFAISDTSFDYGQRIEQRSTYALDFYNGFLMAADSLSEEGMNLNLHVKDTENSTFKLQKMMPDIQGADYDLVVGPLYKKTVEFMAGELKQDEVPVISPLSSTVSPEGLPNLINCIPGTDAKVEHFAFLLNHHYRKGTKIIFVNFVKSDGSSQKDEMMGVKARLQPRSRPELIESVTINEVEMSFEEVSEAIADSSRNVVVTLSDDKVFLSGLISALRSANNEKTKIKLVGSSRLPEMPTVDVDYLNTFNATMADVNFIDYQDEQTVRFIAEYRNRYKGEPSKYAFQGYDVGMYFLRKLWKAGPYFPRAIREPQQMLSTGFDLYRTPDGGFENLFLFLTRIEDYRLVKLSREVELEESQR